MPRSTIHTTESIPIPFDPDPNVWSSDSFTTDRGPTPSELQHWSTAFPIDFINPSPSRYKPTVVSSSSNTITSPHDCVHHLDPIIIDKYALDQPFSDLIKQSHNFVNQTHSHAICQDYAATQIAEGHGINESLVNTHLSSLHQHGIVKTCELIQRQHSDNYLQPDIVRHDYADFPQYDVLLSLAENGAYIQRPSNWSPNMGVGISVRNVTRKMADAVHVRMAQEQALGDLLLVERDELVHIAVAENISFHATELGWVFKPGEKQSDLLGRIIDDYTNSNGPLNTEETSRLMEIFYGPLVLPQLHDMCASLLQARIDFPNQPIFGAKEDVSRAYRRVRIHPADCPLMVVLLPPDRNGVQYYAIRLSQPFGHNASGHAWGVVARAIEWRMNKILSIHLSNIQPKKLYGIYVDDLYSFAAHTFLILVAAAFDEASKIAGVGSRALDKSDLTTELQSLGYTFIDRLDAVFPNPKGWFNLISLFYIAVPWNLKPRDKLPAKLLLRMGSYASRYSTVMLPLRAFVHSFYSDAGDASVFALRSVSARTVQDVWMWRLFLRLAAQQPTLMSTPVHWPVITKLSSQQQADRADEVVFCDAATSTHKIGICVVNGVWASFICPILSHFRQSTKSKISINILEMIAVVAAALVAIEASPHISHLHVWGDNTTSVAWADTNRVNMPICCYLIQMLTLLGASRRILITVGWVEGVRNPIADAISRDFNVPSGSQIQDQLNHPPYRHVQVSPTFISGISHASLMSQCKTYKIAQLVRIVLAGKNTSDSVSSTV